MENTTILIIMGLLLFIFTTNGISINGTDNGTIITHFNTSLASTTLKPMTTMFHTTNIPQYFIDFAVTFTFECDMNANSNITNTTCPDLEAIEDIFEDLLIDLKDILTLNENIMSQSVTITENEDSTITIQSTILTDDETDFDDLKDYVESTEFTSALQDDLNGIEAMSVSNVESTITDSGNTDDKDEDKKPWYDRWLDPLNYDVFQWVVISVILFFLLICIVGCSWWCCCRRKGSNHYNDFMNNPQRYDSEFPGATEMQSFSVVSQPANNVTYVE